MLRIGSVQFIKQNHPRIIDGTGPSSSKCVCTTTKLIFHREREASVLPFLRDYHLPWSNGRSTLWLNNLFGMIVIAAPSSFGHTCAKVPRDFIGCIIYVSIHECIVLIEVWGRMWYKKHKSKYYYGHPRTPRVDN